MYNMANVNYIKKIVVTPMGEAMWARVNTVFDAFEGTKKYVMNMVFNESDEAMMKAMFDKWLEDAKALPENEGKKWRSMEDPRICYKLDEESGKTVFTFKTNAFRTDGTQSYVPVFDKFGKPMGNNVAIGNGSKIKVRFDASWSHKNKDSNNLSMWLTGITVYDLVEFGGGNTAGFEFEEFETGNAVDTETIPF